MRFDHRLTAVANGVMVDRRLGAHNRVEGGAIAIGGPYFETVFWLRTEMFRIRHEGLDSHCRRQGFDPQ
jgi:hypothetical protein